MTSETVSEENPNVAASTGCRSVECGPVPLVIGVTGHRDLHPDHLDQLRARIKEVFGELKQVCPHAPLVVLSPLIDGADQLVAEVALEDGFGAKVIAVLPWSSDLLPDTLPRGGDPHALQIVIEASAAG